MTGLPGVFRSVFLWGNGAGSAPRADICASASVFRGFGASSAADRLPAGRFSGRRRSIWSANRLACQRRRSISSRAESGPSPPARSFAGEACALSAILREAARYARTSSGRDVHFFPVFNRRYSRLTLRRRCRHCRHPGTPSPESGSEPSPKAG